MTVRSALLFYARIAMLAVALFILIAIASSLVGTGTDETEVSGSSTIGALLGMCALNSAVIAYLVQRSRWHGWRLAAMICLLYYGIVTFLTQIETLVFLDYFTGIVPSEMVPRFFLEGAITAVLFAPLTVMIMGKWKGNSGEQTAGRSIRMTPPQWTWRLLAVSAAYVVVYVLFGALVFQPLAGEAFREYYAELPPGELILPLQLGRGLVWAGLAVVVIRIMEGRRAETGLMAALLFAVLMTSNLLPPNPYMPANIRLAHFVEIFASNFLYGWIAVALLWKRTPGVEVIPEADGQNS
jgi:hypothetical protein